MRLGLAPHRQRVKPQVKINVKVKTNPMQTRKTGEFTLDRENPSEPGSPLTASTTAGRPQRDRARETGAAKCP